MRQISRDMLKMLSIMLSRLVVHYFTILSADFIWSGGFVGVNFLENFIHILFSL